MSDLASLKKALLDEREVTESLLRRLEDSEADIADVLNLLDALALIEQHRAPIVDELRERASSERRREEEKSIRQYLLRALDEIGVPQTPGFLEDYLYARDLIVFKSRSMGALRRDEYRAWDRLRRSGRPRVAYIVPCLDESGSALPRWMARSDWPLTARVTVEGVEELWETHRVRALIDAHGNADAEAAPRFLSLIEQYARDVFGDDVGVPPNRARPWIAGLEADVDSQIKRLERSLRPKIERTAKAVEKRDEAKRLWGAATR